jgi:hypothetical protein
VHCAPLIAEHRLTQIDYNRCDARLGDDEDNAAAAGGPPQSAGKHVALGLARGNVTESISSKFCTVTLLVLLETGFLNACAITTAIAAPNALLHAWT